MQDAVPAVLIVGFNRPDLMSRVLRAVEQAEPHKLYIHVDAPREDRIGEAERVEAVRAIARTAVNWPCSVQLYFRQTHAGLRKGVSGAISWFFEHEEEGIILEDDCVPDPSFFRFSAQMLARYRDEERVMMVGGINLLAHRMGAVQSSYVFTRHALVWGWATWRRAWAHYTPEFEGLEAFRQQDALQGMLSSKASRVYLYNKFAEALIGKIQSWAYAWSYSILRMGGCCILPTVNLIQNVGIGDPQATNTHSKSAFGAVASGSMRFPLIHPQIIHTDPNLEDQLFYTFQKKPCRLWIWYLLYTLHLRGVRHP